MAETKVRAPDGSIITVRHPESASQDDILAFAQQEFSNRQTFFPQVEEEPVTPIGGTAENVLAGAGRAITGAGRGAQQTIADFFNQRSFSQLVGQENPVFGPISRGLQEEERLARERDQPLLETTAGQVGNVLGNVAVAAPSVAIPGAATTRGSALVGGALGAVQPTAEEGERAANIGTGLVAGAAGQELGRLVSGAIGNLLARRAASRSAQDVARQPLNELLEESTQAGLRVPPSTTNPTVTNRLLEGVSGKVSTAQGASVLNQRVFNQLAKTSIGLSDDVPLSKATVQNVRREAGKIYDRLSRTGTVTADDQYLDDLAGIQNIRSQISSDFPDLPQAGAEDIDKLVSGLLRDRFSAKSAVELVKRLRNQATTLFKGADDPAKLELARANRAAAEAVDDLLVRHLGRTGFDDLAAAYRPARQTIAQTHTVEAALTEAGNINAKQLAQQLARGKPLSGGLGLSARFANAFPQAARSTTESFPLISPLDLAAFGGPAALTGNPATALIGLSRPLIRRGLLTRPGQSLARPSAGSDVPLSLLDLIVQRGGLIGAGASQ